ncbi:EMB2247 [Symbiodinium sp. KB8]|nr:EMB2247 [Symbiodinium sp. KB8]
MARRWALVGAFACGIFLEGLRATLFAGPVSSKPRAALRRSKAAAGRAGIEEPDEEPWAQFRGFAAASAAAVLVAASLLRPPAHAMPLEVLKRMEEQKVEAASSRSLPQVRQESSQRAMTVARKLEEKRAVLFGAYWCPYCDQERQALGREVFDGRKEYVRYVECDPRGENAQPGLCQAAGVTSFPTWAVAVEPNTPEGLPFELYPGFKGLNGLERMVGLAPPAEEVAEAVAPPVRTNSDAEAITVARRLQEGGAVFYGTYWCPACDAQRQVFGQQAWAKVPYVECDERAAQSDPIRCFRAGVDAIPFWTFADGTTHAGVLTVSDLQAKLQGSTASPGLGRLGGLGCEYRQGLQDRESSGREAKCWATFGKELRSGLWPFATVGWPDESSADYSKFYPATMMETGYDILFFWVARMVMMGLTLTDKAPFKEIYLHGLVRDEKGQKMSKTKGNVVDPLDAIADYGTDALRYALLTSSVPGMDVPVSKGGLENAKAFANKIWNVGRFIITEHEKNAETIATNFESGMQFSEEEIASMLSPQRRWCSGCSFRGDEMEVPDVSVSASFGAEGIDAAQALAGKGIALKAWSPVDLLGFAGEIKEFLQEDVASWYVEASKTRLQDHLGGDPKSPEAATAQKVLLYLLEVSLKLLHPFMPFVTEAVWQRLPRTKSSPRSLMISAWPQPATKRDKEAEGWFTKLCAVTSAVRNARAEQGIAPKERLPLTFWCSDAGFQEALQSERSALSWLARADPDQIEARPMEERPAETPEGCIRIVASEEIEVDMPVPKKEIDVEKELQRLQKQLDQVSAMLESTEKKITPQFMERANPTAKEKILQKRDELKQQKASISAQLEELKGNGNANEDAWMGKSGESLKLEWKLLDVAQELALVTHQCPPLAGYFFEHEVVGPSGQETAEVDRGAKSQKQKDVTRFSSPEVVRLLNEEAPESAGITKADLLKARQGMMKASSGIGISAKGVEQCRSIVSEILVFQVCPGWKDADGFHNLGEDLPAPFERFGLGILGLQTAGHCWPMDALRKRLQETFVPQSTVREAAGPVLTWEPRLIGVELSFDLVVGYRPRPPGGGPRMVRLLLGLCNFFFQITFPIGCRNVVAAASAFLWSFFAPKSARADVGEGDSLPAGARQEDRIRKGLDAWKKLPEKLQTAEDKDKEWDDTIGFLRRIYGLNDDMKYLTRGFRGDKKTNAEALIEKFRKQVKASDKPVKAKDFDKVMEFHKEITGYLEEFQTYLLDATEELTTEAEAEDIS